jgi:hypothetical protein
MEREEEGRAYAEEFLWVFVPAFKVGLNGFHVDLLQPWAIPCTLILWL